MDVLTLNGNWELTQADSETWLPTIIPGCVHTDLLTAGEIPAEFLQQPRHIGDHRAKLQSPFFMLSVGRVQGLSPFEPKTDSKPHTATALSFYHL